MLLLIGLILSHIDNCATDEKFCSSFLYKQAAFFNHD